jgi:hypothetical protein
MIAMVYFSSIIQIDVFTLKTVAVYVECSRKYLTHDDLVGG